MHIVQVLDFYREKPYSLVNYSWVLVEYMALALT